MILVAILAACCCKGSDDSAAAAADAEVQGAEGTTKGNAAFLSKSEEESTGMPLWQIATIAGAGGACLLTSIVGIACCCCCGVCPSKADLDRPPRGRSGVAA